MGRKEKDAGTLRDEEEGKAGWNIKIEEEEGGRGGHIERGKGIEGF